MRRAALIACLCLALPTAAAAQSDESEMSRVRRDQGRIAQRLLSLQEKMDRLAERYDAEGRSRNASLLRDALARLESEGLLERSRVVEQSLDAGLLATVEQQDELTAGLEAIYALLRDRTDVEQNAERVNMLEQALAELGFLQQDELGLLQRTRGASDSPAELLDEALSVANELQQQLEDSAGSTAELDDALRGLGESRQAAALAEAQRALRERAAQAGADDVQRQLAAALEGLRASLAEPSSSADEGGDEALQAELEAARERARELAAQAAEAMARAERRLAEGRVGGEGRPREEGSAGAQGASGEGAQQGGAGEPSEGGESGASGSEGAESASSQGAQGSSASSSQQGAQGASGAESQQGSQGSDGSESSQGSQASSGAESQAGAQGDSGAESQQGAQGSGSASSQQGAQGAQDPSTQQGATPGDEAPDDGSAEQAMDDAAEALEQAAAALGETERALALQRNRARAEGLAAARQAGGAARELEQLMERLESAEPEEGPELLDRTRELLADVDRAQDALEQGDSAGASSRQQAAAQDLAALMRALQARREGATDAPPEPVDDAGRAQLAAEQREVQRRLRELMDRLSELPDQRFREPGERASQAMEQAEQDLQQGRLDEAGMRQQEAADELAKAQEQLEAERDRYDQLRQDEVIFRLTEELTTTLERQRALSAETLGIEELRASSGRLGRSQRRALARLGGEQRDLAVGTRGVSESLAEDGSVAFVFALDRIVDDMDAAADRLVDESTDVLVQALQGGVERRLEDLLDVLEQEKQRSREQLDESGEQPPQQNQGSSPLVPPVAELLLVQRLELMALERVERFGELFPDAADGAPLTPVESRELERWALEHARITDLFESLIPEAPEAAGEQERAAPLPPAPLPPAPPPPGPDEEDDR